MRRRPIALVAALAGLALAAPSAALADCQGAATVPDAGNLAAIGRTTLCLLNEQRAAQGLPALTEEARLSRSSTAFSQRMVAQQFFEHVAPDGNTLLQRLEAVGYIGDGGDWSAGENIAWGQGDLATPGSIVTAWMNSPGHRANILSGDYAQVGLGVATGSPIDAAWGATYTTDFGSTDAAASTLDRSGAQGGATGQPGATAASRRKPAARTRPSRARAACTRAAAKRGASHGRRTRARACTARAGRSARR